MSEFLFFSGKGGVGKTTMACATAVARADAGVKTLIVTTDPASNLADVFQQAIGHQVTPIVGVENLWAMEIESDKATEEYRERLLAPMRAVMPPEFMRVVEEQFNSPCTTEIAAFDRFVDFMDESDYALVIFDTAPTGHTVRLLELPVDWSKHIEESAKGAGQTCMGPVQAIQSSKEKYDRAIALLRDPARTTFVFVVQPEETPIAEARRSAAELLTIGIQSSQLIINGILPPEAEAIPFFARRKAMQERYLQAIERDFPLPKRRMYLLEDEVAGLDVLRAVGQALTQQDGNGRPPQVRLPKRRINVERYLTPNGVAPRLLFFTGKGGVGKTVVSAATAVWLAERGYRTLLVTTDPAAHLGDVFGQPVGADLTPVHGVENLFAARVDQKQAADEYKARILSEAAGKFSEDMLTAMREELESPCTEEMAAFEKFLQYATRTDFDVIAFDTAPTGHTLRLLALPLDWQGQLEAMVAAKPGSQTHAETKARYDNIIEMLRDRERTTFIFVVYPENTPIVEAHRASEDLQQAGISTSLVVANQVLPPEVCTSPFFRGRWTLQQKYLPVIAARFDVPVATLPLFDAEVKRLPALRAAGETLWGEADDTRLAS